MPGPAGCPRVLPNSALLPVPPRSVSQPLSRSALSPWRDSHLSPWAPPGRGRPLLSLQPRTLEAQRQAGLPAHLLCLPFRCPPSTWRLTPPHRPLHALPGSLWESVLRAPRSLLLGPPVPCSTASSAWTRFPHGFVSWGKKEILSYLGFLLHTIPHTGR